MNAPPLRVADVLRAGCSAYLRRHRVPAFQLKAVRHILACRTPALGGHVWRCASCGQRAVLYNSCRDRHCPTCQGAARETWLEKRMGELIPAPYFHVVFTLPHDLNPLIRHNREALIDLFFREVNATLQEFARDPQWKLEGQLGFLAVLHTWSQTLLEHYHLHCAVPGGVWRAAAKPLGEDGRSDTDTWVSARRNWLFRAASLADRFRNRYLRALRKRLEAGRLALPAGAVDWNAVCAKLALIDWIVYAKKPFAGPRQVLEYLGRYTHKVATRLQRLQRQQCGQVSDYRILRMEGDTVSFRYRDRADGDAEKQMTLPIEEFIRRFLLHILPPRLQKIRFYGWMARTVRAENLRRIRTALNVAPPIAVPKPPRPAPECPSCGEAAMILEGVIGKARGPPPGP